MPPWTSMILRSRLMLSVFCADSQALFYVPVRLRPQIRNEPYSPGTCRNSSGLEIACAFLHWVSCLACMACRPADHQLSRIFTDFHRVAGLAQGVRLILSQPDFETAALASALASLPGCEVFGWFGLAALFLLMSAASGGTETRAHGAMAPSPAPPTEDGHGSLWGM